MDPLVPQVVGLGSKMRVMQSSLRKLEDASYTLAIRGQEYAAYPTALKELMKQLTSSNPVDGRDQERGQDEDH